MKLLIQKDWTSEEEVEVPDNLTPDELQKWCVDHAYKFANHNHEWWNTTVLKVPASGQPDDDAEQVWDCSR